jgi:hypothetical protein
MATYTWTANTSGLWAVSSNRTPAGVPSTGDTALITLPGAYLISEPGDVWVADLTISDAAAEISVTGSLSVTSGTTITVGTIANTATPGLTNLSNAGTITNSSSTSGAFLYLTGTTDVQSLENIGGNGGYLASGAVVNNAGGTLDAAFFSGQTVLSIGTIDGGAVADLSSPGTISQPSLNIPTPELNGVTWLGEMNLEESHVVILNGLTLRGTNGSGTGTLALGGVAGFGGTLEFQGNQTLDNVNVSGDGTLLADNTLTIGAGVSFDYSRLSFGGEPAPLDLAGAGTIVNDGSLLVYSAHNNPPEEQNSTASIASADFQNSGIIDIRDISVPGIVFEPAWDFGAAETDIGTGSKRRDRSRISPLCRWAALSRRSIPTRRRRRDPPPRSGRPPDRGAPWGQAPIIPARAYLFVIRVAPEIDQGLRGKFMTPAPGLM